MFDNYYNLFQLPVNYEIDLDLLDEAYFSLLKKSHPDNNFTADESIKISNLKQSMFINEGYEILKDPIKRIFYLLKLEQIEIGENSQIKPSYDLLNEIFEFRELLSNLKDRQEIKNLEVEISNKITHSIDMFKSNYPNSLELATEDAIKLRYYQKIIEEIKNRNNESYIN